jgi:murein DD-endopeptidase MepM/ murein hydrolase activator NlpD
MRPAIAVALLVLALAACARRAPPAPVVHGGGPVPQIERPESVVVQPGDTLYAIARRWEVPVRTLIETNGLQPPYALLAGARVRLPQIRTHVVQPGETLYSVSRRYNVEVTSLARTNRIEPPYTVRLSEMLILPDPPAVATAPTSLPTPTVAPPVAVSPVPPPVTASPTPPPVAVSPLPAPVEPQPPEPPRPEPQRVERAPAPAPPPAVAMAPPPVVEPAPPVRSPPPEPPRAEPPAASEPPPGRGFIWPVKGRVVASFGPAPGGTHNDGINIAAPAGTPVVAAEDGVVAYAGNELRGFGNLILLKHSNGWMSAYAHCDAMLVKKGARVRRGQTIARVGATGAVAEPQLHFELRRGTRALDPTQQLSSGSTTS